MRTYRTTATITLDILADNLTQAGEILAKAVKDSSEKVFLWHPQIMAWGLSKPKATDVLAPDSK